MGNYKKLFLISSFFVLFFITQNLSAADVVTYYNEIPVSLLEENYKLKLINNKWKATQFAASSPEVTVDIRNGFINIIDQGTGGQYNTTEVAFFKSKNAIPFIVISSKKNAGVAMGEYFVKVFQKSGLSWKDVTTMVIPVIKLTDFLSDKVIEHQAIRDIKPVNVFNFNLPRFGTLLKVTLDINWIDYYLMIQETLPEVKKAYLHLKKIAIYKTLCYKWDKANSKFVFSHKLK